MTDEIRPLKIAIAGAGIGGLAAAIGLREEGHEVTLFERSGFANEVGAAINVAPNSNVVLRHWGVFLEEHGATQSKYFREYDPQGNFRSQLDIWRLADEFPAPWHFMHRADLHNALKQRALDLDAPGAPVKLHLASAVASVDIASTTLTLQDGTTHTADVIIGADGNRSETRGAVAADGIPATPSGITSYRWTVPRSAALSSEHAAQFVHDHESHLQVWAAPDRRIVVYPCRRGELLNCAAVYPDRLEPAGSSDDPLAMIHHIFRGFDRAALALLDMADTTAVGLWRLLDRPPLPRWASGRVALAGDAAHPIMPHQAQGGNQAIEDGAALSVMLQRGTRVADVPARLQLYEGARKPRAEYVQHISRQLALNEKRDPGFGDDALENLKKQCMHNPLVSAKEYLERASGGEAQL